MFKPLLILFALICGISNANPVMFGSPSFVSVTSTSTQVLPFNNLRSYLLIVNTGGAPIYANFGAPGSGSGIPIPAGGNYEPLQVPGNAIYLISPSGSLATVLQGQ